MKKYFYLSERDIIKLSNVILNSSFSIYTIVRINGKRVMFFHNDLPNSEDGLNYKLIKTFLTLKRKNKVDSFVCCYPEETGINKHCYLGSSARGIVGAGTDEKGMFLSYTKKK